MTTEARNPPHTTTDVAFLKHDIPSEAQLVLLSLDYLRDLRRAYADPNDLLEAEGLHSDWLTLAIYALDRSFANPAALAKHNDSWKPPQGNSYASSSVDVDRLPPIDAMAREICYTENPNRGDDDDAEGMYDQDLEAYAWYDYDDSNSANAHRFYSLNGLSSGPTLSLGEIATAGLAHLQGRSRQEAEQEMVASPLFEQFLETVKAKGFFDTGNDIPRDEPVEEEERIQMNKQMYSERYQKAVAKFRTKLAAKAQSDGVGTTLADFHHSRRMRRCLAVRKERANNNNEIPPDARSVITNISKKIDRFGPKSPSKSNPADMDEAERLKSLGNAYMQKKEYQAALNSYTQALKLSPAGPASHVYFSNRAAALLSMKKFRDAILDSERALTLKPDYAKAHARLGLAHFLLGDYKQSMQAYTVALKYEPENKSSRSYLEKAARRLASGHDDHSHVPITSSFSVVSEWDKSSRTGGRQSGAIPTEENIRNQKEAEKLKLRGNSFMASKNYEAALDAYSDAIGISRDGPQSHVYFANRSAALCYLERYRDAAKDAEQSLRLRPTYGKAHSRLGLARFFLNDFEGSVTAYKAALHFEPDDAASRSYLAKAQLKLEKQKEDVYANLENETKNLVNDPEMIRIAKKALSDPQMMQDPEMMKIAQKAVSNPAMMEALLAARGVGR